MHRVKLAKAAVRANFSEIHLQMIELQDKVAVCEA
jgi:hypothetical protein